MQGRAWVAFVAWSVGLWTCPVVALAGTPSFNPLHRLACLSESAVVVDRAEDLAKHGIPLLNWIGLSFPALAPARAGVLRGQAGFLNVLNVESLKQAGIPPDAPLAMVELDFSPAPVVAVGGLDAAGCEHVRVAVKGGSAGHDAAWQKAGLCVTVVGECRQHACAFTGLRSPQDAPGQSLEGMMDGLPTGNVRAWVSGKRLKRFVPPEAERLVKDVQALAMKVDAAANPWRAVASMTLSRAPANWRDLQPLDNRGLPTDAQPVLEFSASPHPEAWERWLGPRAQPLGVLVTASVGKGLDKAFLGANVQSASVGWKGITAIPGSKTERSHRLFLFHGGMGVVSGSAAKADTLRINVARMLKAQGYREDSGLWVNGSGVIGIELKDTNVVMATGRTAERGIEFPVSTAQPPLEAQGSVLRIRGDGRRVKSALDGFSLLAGVSTPELTAALAARELMGPSLGRLANFTAWVVPSSNGLSWRMIWDGAVEMGARPPR